MKIFKNMLLLFLLLRNNAKKLCNLLSLIYSYKLVLEDAPNKTLKSEIKNILIYCNKMDNDIFKDEPDFIKEYIKHLLKFAI